MEQLLVTHDLAIPQAELAFSFDRSPGPGGQNVNKTNTRAEVRFSIAGSSALSDEQRRRLRTALRAQLTRDGEVVVRSSRFRSQAQNRRDCLDKLAAMLRRAVRPPPPRRRPTRPSRASQARRLDRKKRHGQKKNLRRRPDL